MKLGWRHACAIVVACLFVLLATPVSGYATPPSWDVSQLSTNPLGGATPQVSGDRVVWAGWNADHGVVLTWKAGDSTPTVIDTGGSAVHPQVSGDRVVWENDVGGSPQIYTWVAGDSQPTNLTPGQHGGASPQVSGDRVVWTDYVNGQMQTLTWKSGDSRPTTLTTGADNSYPQVSGDRVAWTGLWTGGEGDVSTVFTWAPGDSNPVSVANGRECSDPVISGDRIVWTALDANSHAQVVTWKAGDSQPTTITSDPTDHTQIAVSGDRVAWTTVDSVAHVHVWEAGDSAPTTLTTDAFDNSGPHVSGDRFVWTGMVDGVGQVFTWEVGDSKPTTLTSGATDHLTPEVSGTRVVWATLEGDNGQIYTALPTVPSGGDHTAPQTTISSLPAGWVAHDVAFSLNASDADSPVGIATYYGLNAPATTPYSGEVSVAAEGTTTVAYRSVDASGNWETPKTATIRIDKSPPVTGCGIVGGTTYVGNQTFALTPSDGYSGVGGTRWQLDSSAGAWTSGTSVLVTAPPLGAAPHTLFWYSTDLAGNSEATHSVTFDVAAPPTPTALSNLSVSPKKLRHGKAATFSATISPSAAATSAPTLLSLARKETKIVVKRVGRKKKRVKVVYWHVRKTIVMTANSAGRFSAVAKLSLSGSWQMQVSHLPSASYLGCSAVKAFAVK